MTHKFAKNTNTINLYATNEDLKAEKVTSPDQILMQYGANNAYLLFVWMSMALVWGLSAMPMLVSAFLISNSCSKTNENCTLKDGTIVKEFNLVDNRNALADFTASAFLIGVTIGSLFLPALSDRFGRRPIVLLSMCFLGLFGVASAFAPEIYSLIALRFLQGCFFTGCGITNWVLAYESIPFKLRSYTALTFGLFWVLGYCLVAPIAYFLQDWRWVMISVSAPSVVVFIIYYFTIPESFHYIVLHSKTCEIKRWIERANYFSEWNGNPNMRINTKELVHSLQSVDITSEQNSTFSEKNFIQFLATNRTLSIYTLIMIYLWTCDTFVYYGLSLFSTQLAGNKYINFVLIGLIEIPSYLISPVLLNRLGRKRFISLCHFLAAVSFFTVVLINNPILCLCMWLLGKFAISCAFTSLFVYASELFPTIVRNGCIGVCSIVARFGGVLVPSIHSLRVISPMLPTFFFGICATIGGSLTLFLPETANCELPDSPDDML